VTVLGCHLAQVREALSERCPVCHGYARAVIGHCQYGHRLTGGSQYVYALMPALYRQVDPRPRRDASPTALVVNDPERLVGQQLVRPGDAPPFCPRVLGCVFEPAAELSQDCKVGLVGAEEGHLSGRDAEGVRVRRGHGDRLAVARRPGAASPARPSGAVRDARYDGDVRGRDGNGAGHRRSARRDNGPCRDRA